MPIPNPPPVPDRGDPQITFSQKVFNWLTWFTTVAIPEINSIVLGSAISAYQEGTFTPVVEGGTTAGVGTYSFQYGRFNRISNRVFFDILIIWSAHTGTGGIVVAGLPFASLALNRAALSVVSNNIVYTAGSTLRARVNASASSIQIVQEPSGGGALITVPMDTAGELSISGSYLI